MKVLFLDIDGVLNSTRTEMAFGGWPHALEDIHKFDLVAIALIARIADLGVKIVLSSDWRLAYPLASIGCMLCLPLADRTPHLPFGTRGLEIKTWLDAHEGEVTHYAIVDDVMQMLVEQTKYFVKTNSHAGLSYDDFKNLCRILGVNPVEANVRHWRTDGKTLSWD